MSDLPRILVIDDILGRMLPSVQNEERAAFCRRMRLRDITGEPPSHSQAPVIDPIADAVFCRGQIPRSATVGDSVENDLAGVLEVVAEGWFSPSNPGSCWALVLLDLSFRTGELTVAANRAFAGLPTGRPSDDEPAAYFGLAVLRELQQRFPHLPVTFLSSKAREDVRMAGVTFLAKDESDAPVRLREHLRQHGLLTDMAGRIVGHSLALRLALRDARRARHDSIVLLQGESGAGKELLARYIHGDRTQGGARPFVALDCGGLTPELYRSELFGHHKGAFTGALADRVGKIVTADRGDLFLDEIGNMPLDVQKGLLRVVEDSTVTPLGSDTERKVSVQILTATNADLDELAADNRFQRDFLHRLQMRTISLPTLAQRRDDLPLLVERFVRDAERGTVGSRRREIHPEAIKAIVDAEWPGSVRQLRNCLLRAVRDYPEVDALVSAHLRMPQRPQHTAPVSAPISHRDLSEVRACFEGFEHAAESLGRCLAAQDQAGLRGGLPRIQRAFGLLLARYLDTTLKATSRSTNSEPDGEPKIQPAMRLATGDTELTAYEAADLLKRIGRLFGDRVEKEPTDYPYLARASKKAHALRKTRRRG